MDTRRGVDSTRGSVVARLFWARQRQVARTVGTAWSRPGNYCIINKQEQIVIN